MQGQEITTELAYDDLNLIAEIGGYVGLFLGISIFGLTKELYDCLKNFIQFIKGIKSKH